MFLATSALLKKATGLFSCNKTAPIPWLEASHSIVNSLEKLGRVKIGEEINLFFKFSKAF